MILKIPNELSTSLVCLLNVISKKNIGTYLGSLMKEDFVDSQLNITKKGLDILKQVTFESTNYDEVMELAKEYRNCFKNDQGKALKPGVTGNLKLLVERLIEFKEEYPEYSNTHIIKAIQNYISSEGKQGFQYLQKSHFTIRKLTNGEVDSRLLTFCEEYNEEDDNSNLTFGVDV